MQMNAIIYGHLDMQKKQNEFDKLGIQNYLRRTFGMFIGFGDKARIKGPLPVVEEMKKYLKTVSAVYEEKDAGR